MAGGVNIKLGVSGVAQFKSAMKESQSAVKTLDAELKLNEAQLKLTGDAEEYLKNKTALLQKQIEEQKNAVKAAQDALEAMRKNGVSESSEAFRKMQQEVLNSQTKLANMESSLKGVGEAGEDAKNEVSGMNQQLKRIGDGVNYQNVLQGFDTIKAGIGGVISKAWQMGEALVKNTLGAGSWADELVTTAAQYEISTDELQRMRKTAAIIDTDAETILDAQDKLKKNREGQSKEFMGALAYLGIDPKGMSDLDLFWKAGDAIQKLGRTEDKVTYAQQIFGRSWRELLPLFKAGRQEYMRTYNSWSVVEQDQIDALGKMDDSYQTMTKEWETFKMEMLSAFAGPLTEGMDTITGLFQELNKYLDTKEGKEMLQQLGDTITSLITNLVDIDPEAVVSGLQTVIEKITGALEWIAEPDNQDKVVGGLKAILGGWAALQITGTALQVMNLVNGLRGLAGGGAAAGGSGVLSGITSFITGGGLSTALTAMSPLAVIAAAVTPAVLAQQSAEDEWIKTYEQAQEAAKKAEEAGYDASMLKQLNEASGIKVDANGNYQRNFLGFLNMNPDEKAAYVLQSLGDWKTRGVLHSDIRSYGADLGGVNGWDPWSMMLRIWGMDVKDAYGRSAGPVEQADIDAMVEYLVALETKKAEELTKNPMGDAERLAGESGQNTLTSADVKNFQGLPGQMQQAVTNGLRGVNVYIDGQLAGRLLAPYIGEEFAGSLLTER